MGVLAKRKVLEAAAGAVLLMAVFGLILYPADTVSAAKDGLQLCLNVILPSLFPFFVLSAMLVELGFAQYMGRILERVMRPLFRVSGACSIAFALGFIGGYPTGAKTAIAIYEKGLCTKTEAERLLGFCNNSGPAFILGVVGAGIFSSGRAGILLYLAHAAASILVGILFRFYRRDASAVVSKPASHIETIRLTTSFTRSVTGSFLSVLNICAFVIFFAVAIRLLFLFGIIPALASLLGRLTAPFGASAKDIENLLTGLIELSSGVWTLRDAAGAMRQQLAMAAFMLGWAGISVHCQVLSFIGESGLSARTYVIGKVLHGMLSAALTYFLAGLVPFSAPVSSYLVEQLNGISTLSFGSSLRISLTTAAVLTVLVALFYAARYFYRSGKRQAGLRLPRHAQRGESLRQGRREALRQTARPAGSTAGKA